jgi:hypothetical protein
MSRLDNTISDIAYLLDCLRALRSIYATSDCNECIKKMECAYCPKAGQIARYNCPFFARERENNEL